MTYPVVSSLAATDIVDLERQLVEVQHEAWPLDDSTVNLDRGRYLEALVCLQEVVNRIIEREEKE